MPNTATTTSQLNDHCQTIPDPRTGPAQRHEWLDILLIAVGARLCGADSFTALALFGRC